MKMFENLTRTLFCGLLLIHFIQATHEKRNAHCDPSSCGDIQNISYPFRLRDDPPRCGDSSYELVCENNTTFMYLNSHKYHVQSINYQNYTIRLVDASIKNNTCSFPHQPPNYLEFLKRQTLFSIRRFNDRNVLLVRPVTFLSCKYPENFSFYTNLADHCVDQQRDGSRRHKYIKVDYLNASDISDACRIDLVVMTSMPFEEDRHNFSLSEIHSLLMYGFEVSWFNALCGHKCRGVSYYCQWDGYGPKCEEPFFGAFLCIGDEPGCTGMSLQFREVIFGVLTCVVGITVSVLVFVLALKVVIGWPLLLGLLIYKLRRRHMSMFDVIESFLRNHNNLVPIRYSYSDVKKMTRGFREKLGQGGYGSVYKGKLRSGHYVAVKVLSAKSKSNGQDFMNEVATVGRIHQVNVVKLVGYCAEGSKRALIYDLMPNGSLDKYILRQEANGSLNWEKKYEIAIGVARGIEYLHRGCEIQILHFDIKPHNILLDENFTPKISDFGLAKFYSTEKNIVTLTAARGTIGYVAPELINRGIGGVSYKADVYSFGMLLMEMVGLKKDLVQNGDDSSQYFPYWIYSHLEKWNDIETGNVNEIDDMDEKITRKMAIVGLWCIQMSPSDRPSMSGVIEMLESEVESLQIPPQPSHEVVAQTWDTDSTTDSIALLCEDNSKGDEYV